MPDGRTAGVLGLGFVGCGWIAERHAQAALSLPETRIVIVSSRTSEHAASFGQAVGATSTTAWEDVVNHPGVDAVVIGSPNALHASQAIAALTAGKHVLVEKPMATTLADGKEMVETAREHGRVLLVGHMWRYRREVIAFRAAVRAKRFGDVERTRSHGCHVNFAPAGWFLEPALSGGGALIDLGVHAIDTTRFILDEPSPRRIAATIVESEDNPGIDAREQSRSNGHRAYSPKSPSAGGASRRKASSRTPRCGASTATGDLGTTTTRRLRARKPPDVPGADAGLRAPERRPPAGRRRLRRRALRAGPRRTRDCARCVRRFRKVAPVSPGGDVFLGVDAGATKTTACVCDAHGTIRALTTGGPSAWEAIGVEAAAAGIAACVTGALGEAGARISDVKGCGFGLAGLDWPEDIQTVAGMLAPLGLPGHPLLVNDAFAALRAGVDDNIGCVSCAGTGGVTAARNRHGRTFQTFAVGWGEQAGAIGLVGAAINAVVGAHYGTAPATLLSGLLLTAVGADTVDELVRLATRGGRPPGPELAPLVLDAAALDDQVATDIATMAGTALAHTAAAAATMVGLEGGPYPVVRSGGVHLAGSRCLDDAFRLTLHAAAPTARVRELRLPPACGAALLALDAADVRVAIGDLERSLGASRSA